MRKLRHRAIWPNIQLWNGRHPIDTSQIYSSYPYFKEKEADAQEVNLIKVIHTSKGHNCIWHDNIKQLNVSKCNLYLSIKNTHIHRIRRKFEEATISTSLLRNVETVTPMWNRAQGKRMWVRHPGMWNWQLAVGRNEERQPRSGRRW